MNKTITIVIALLAIGTGLLLSWYLSNNRVVELEDATWFGDQARALPAFELVDQDGESITRASLEGNWSLMFFGYTSCPDICPTTLQTMSAMLQTIDDPDVRDAVRVYFVSVDPGRDTQEVLASYVGYFNPDFIAATAPEEQLRRLTKPLGIAHEIHKKSEEDVTYGVDHSGSIVLINPQAEYAGLFGAPHDPATMARDITLIVEYN